MKKLLLSTVTTLIIGSSAIMTSAHAIIVVGDIYRAVNCNVPNAVQFYSYVEKAVDKVCFEKVNYDSKK